MSGLAGLFEPEPSQWGLRGDPLLWQCMRTHFSATPLPETVAELEQRLADAFEKLTGRPLTTPDSFFVEAFARGGLSSGQVSPAFWRETALPLLLERFARARRQNE